MSSPPPPPSTSKDNEEKAPPQPGEGKNGNKDAPCPPTLQGSCPVASALGSVPATVARSFLASTLVNVPPTLTALALSSPTILAAKPANIVPATTNPATSPTSSS